MPDSVKAIFLPTAAIGLLVLALTAGFPRALGGYFHEGGVVETLSAVLLFAAAVLLPARMSGAVYLSIILALLAEREFDGALLSDGNPLRIGQEWLETHLLHNRLFVAALGVWLLWALARKGWPMFRDALRAQRPEPFLLLLAVGFAALGQIAGEGAKHFAALLSETAYVQLMIVEELAELYFSVGIFAALLVGWPQRQIAGRRNERPDRHAPHPR